MLGPITACGYLKGQLSGVAGDQADQEQNEIGSLRKGMRLWIRRIPMNLRHFLCLRSVQFLVFKKGTSQGRLSCKPGIVSRYWRSRFWHSHNFHTDRFYTAAWQCIQLDRMQKMRSIPTQSPAANIQGNIIQQNPTTVQARSMWPRRAYVQKWCIFTRFLQAFLCNAFGLQLDMWWINLSKLDST